MDEQRQKLAYTVENCCEVADTNRSAIYKAIATGDLESFKIGRRRMVSSRALKKWLDGLERKGRAAA